MTLVAAEILLINDEIVIGIQLPKPAVQHVEVLVAEKLSDLVDIVLGVHLVKHVKQVTVLEVTISDLTVIIHI